MNQPFPVTRCPLRGPGKGICYARRLNEDHRGQSTAARSTYSVRRPCKAPQPSGANRNSSLFVQFIKKNRVDNDIEVSSHQLNRPLSVTSS